MPLAITQAAAFINRRAPRMTVSKYLEELSRSDTDRAKLLRRDGSKSNSIIITWHVSFTYIRKTRASAAPLLASMSLFDREGIPEYLLCGYREDNEMDADFEDDMDADFEDDIEMLRGYYLVGMSEGDNMFEMHRLVQFSMKKWLEQHDELEGWKERFVDTMYKAFPLGKYENWSKCQPLFPHAEAMRLSRPIRHKYLRRWARVLNSAVWYAKECGRYGRAEVLSRECLKAFVEVLDKEHPDTLAGMNNLAVVLTEQRKYEEAEEMIRKVLELKEKMLGTEHPETMTSMNNLAQLSSEQGRYEEAEEMHRKTLQLREKVLEKEHPDTLTSMNNLATVLTEQGKYEEAEEMYQQALDLREKVLGEKHPKTYWSVYGLAFLLSRQGRFEEAEGLYRRAVDGFRETLGEHHLETTECQWSYSRMKQAMRDHAEA